MSYFSGYTNAHHSHRLAFEPVNELADGLGDEIQAERQEAAISLEETPDADALVNFWNNAVTEARHDPEWSFSDDEDNTPMFY